MSAARDVGVNTTCAGCGPGSGVGGGGTTGRGSSVRRCCGAVCGAGCWAAWGRVAGGGGGGAVAWEGARRRSDVSDVCVVLRVGRSPRYRVRVRRLWA